MKHSFPDLFGKHAEDYQRYRPLTPTQLCQWVAQNAPSNAAVLDCGTGNGQAAVGLADFFERVIAIDASAEQISQATQCPNIAYRVAPAEALPVPQHSVDAVTCATALHWFDTDRFFAEIKRVLVPGGLFAAWTYTRAEIDPKIETIVSSLANDVLTDYWHPSVKNQMALYTAPLPFREIEPPQIQIENHWNVHEFVGYLRTWSAYRQALRAGLPDPMIEVANNLKSIWGDQRTVTWNLIIKTGFV